MAVPTVETDFTSATADPGASITLNKPASAASGKTGIIIVGNDDNSAVAQWDDVTNKPTGFTLINELGNATQDCHAAAFWRVLDGTEAATINVPAATIDQYWGYYIIVSGAHASSPLEAVGTDSVGTGTSAGITEVTTGVNDCLCFYLLSFDGADGFPFSVSGTGWTEQGEIEVPTSGGGNDASGCWGTRDLATAGGAGTATVTNSVSDGWVGFQFSIQPPSVGGISIPVVMNHLRNQGIS